MIAHIPKGQEPEIDRGYSLPLALWTRSEILLKLMDGVKAMRDIQFAARILPDFKQNPEYFARLAKCHKSKESLIPSSIPF